MPVQGVGNQVNISPSDNKREIKDAVTIKDGNITIKNVPQGTTYYGLARHIKSQLNSDLMVPTISQILQQANDNRVLSPTQSFSVPIDQLSSKPVTQNPETTVMGNETNYQLKAGDGLMHIAKELTGGYVHPNTETMMAILEYNNIPEDASLDLSTTPTFKFPKVPAQIKLLSKIGIKVQAYCVKDGDGYETIAENFTGNYANAEQIKFLNGGKGLHPKSIIYLPIASNQRWEDKIKIPDIKIHTISDGESYKSLAVKYTGNYANQDVLKEINKDRPLIPGKKILVINLPESDKEQRIYRVKKGDILNDIVTERAKSLGVENDKTKVALIKELTIENSRINNPKKLDVGQFIYLPSPSDVKGKSTTTNPIKKTTPVTKVAETKQRSAVRPATFTRGLTTDNKYWKEMEEILVGKNFSMKQKSDIFDMAHLIIKEVQTTNDSTPQGQYLEMQLVALTIMNRKAVCDVSLKAYKNMWGGSKGSSNVPVQDIILHPYQYSSFNKSTSKNVTTMPKYYSKSRWNMAIKAAAKIYSGNKKGIPEKFHKVVNYFNPDVKDKNGNKTDPAWVREKYNGVNRYVYIELDGCAHRFYSEDDSMWGYDKIK